MQRKVIFVLGMHRSGTSALARTLSFLGCNLPHNLVPETPTNPTGHWEPNVLMTFNNEILDSAGSKWDDWLEFNPLWYSSPVAEHFIERASGILFTEYGTAPLFVLKDPRNCRLTRFWFDVFDREAIEPLVILPLRSPLEVTASLEARDGMYGEHAMLLWLRHVLDAEHGSRGRRRLFATYEELLQNWAHLADRMQTAFNITWPKSIAHAAKGVGNFLDADHRHHVRPMHMLMADPAVSQWVHDADRIFVKWAHEGEDRKDHAALDQIRQQLNAAGPTLSRLIRDICDARRTNEELRVQVAASQDEAATLWENNACSSDQHAAEVAHHIAHSQELERQHDVLTNELEQQRALGEALAAALSQEQDARRDQAQRLAQRDEALQSLLTEKMALEANLSADNERLNLQLVKEAESRNQLDEEKSDLARRLCSMEQALEQAKADLAHSQHELADARSALRQREEEIFQTLATLEKEQKDHAAARTVADQKLRVAQGKLRAADEWVFRLAGDRKLAEDQTILALKRVAVAEKASADLAARIADLERKHLLDRQDWERQQKDISSAAATHAVLLAQEQAEVQRWRIAQADSAAQVEALTQSLREKESAAESLNSRLATSKAQADRQRRDLEGLSARLGEIEAEAERAAQQAQWLKEVNAVVTGYPRWWVLLPGAVQDKLQRQRLRRRGLFDAESYLNRYPDVSSSGMDPLRHYILHGIAENRTL